MSTLHISISAEPVFHIGTLAITNSMLSTWVVVCLILAFVVNYHRQYASIGATIKPTRLQSFVEYLIESFLNLAQGTTESFKKSRVFFPFVITFFIFIILSNWSGLIPGNGTIGYRDAEGIFIPYFRAPTADLNTTIALALFTMTTIQVMGIRYLGLAYFHKFINFSNPINFYVGVLEFISEVSRIVSFAFRLFGNIFAGEVLLSVIAMLAPVIAPLPFLAMEVFVGFIQALVFALLSLSFMNIASTAEHE